MDLEFQNVKTFLMYMRGRLLRHYAPISYHYGNALGSVEMLKKRKDVAGLLIKCLLVLFETNNTFSLI